ncbi:MAG: DNA-processing protein DprA [Muribaculum sp.]|nr:DNA-processing protein DprA [Muribaculaceae bacterium]MCM1081450.1 DNA-processing protein DprA [Muribaculum sp.]
MNLVWKIAFSQVKGLRPGAAGNLLARLGGEEAFFKASDGSLDALVGRHIDSFSSAERQKLLERAKREAEFVERNAIKPIYFADASYPARLRECNDAPLMLFTMGDCDMERRMVIGIVGTRKATVYGSGFVKKIVPELSEMVGGLVVVSGLAYGIDIVAHRAALEAGVPTVAVLAHGLNMIYPVAHRNTAVEIARGGGMLMSEYMSDAVVHKGNFLTRNRIVAGLCDGLLVAESAENGGALVTARLANDYNREVMALPGRVGDKYSVGCNKLIMRNEARMVTSAADIVDALNWPTVPQEGMQRDLPVVELDPEKERVVKLLADSPDGESINAMCLALGKPVHELSALLLEMECDGLVTVLPGSRYILVI